MLTISCDHHRGGGEHIHPIVDSIRAVRLFRECTDRILKVARLQSEFCTKDFLRATNFLTKNAPKFSPKFLSLCSVGQKKSPENSLQISH